MKLLTLKILFLFCFLGTIKVQESEKKINCVILIDNNLIGGLTGTLTGTNSNDEKFKIEFGYEIGEIRLSAKDYNFLQSLNKEAKLNMVMRYVDMEDGRNDEYVYSKSLEAIDFRQRYVVFRIYNCSRSDEYKVFFESPRYHNPYPIMKKGRKINCELN